ncbi:MAG: hypothetical protein ABIJ53_09605, partial [Verrucomicrobiota bacterium]
MPTKHAKGREKRKDFPFKFSVPFVSVMWSLGFKKEWEKWNQGSIVYGQWVKVKTLTGATRETLEKHVGVT